MVLGIVAILLSPSQVNPGAISTAGTLAILLFYSFSTSKQCHLKYQSVSMFLNTHVTPNLELDHHK
jgi:hypothetical protein